MELSSCLYIEILAVNSTRYTESDAYSVYVHEGRTVVTVDSASFHSGVVGIVVLHIEP